MYIITAGLFIFGLVVEMYLLISILYRVIQTKDIIKTIMISILIVFIVSLNLGFIWLIKTWLEGIPSV